MRSLRILNNKAVVFHTQENQSNGKAISRYLEHEKPSTIIITNKINKYSSDKSFS